ncbi:hypothetical protein DXG03_004819 [Asterophora parasitica]|uniref:peptide-methionine (S)-S-oxide reductase n=1 Tax=Asterophora parasitica TaxID=117018 RepID=A0A9P7G0Q6_9AGAR|nr:hypothetical protein DXG03_004819 [Asterophora parasitica]
MSTAATQTQTATFSLGCFWGAEHLLQKHYPPSENNGILKTTVGYTGGHLENPDYDSVGTGKTGHAESVKIEFDPSVVSYDELVGKATASELAKYRSSIFTHSDEQRAIAQRVTEEVQAKHFTPKDQRIVTEILPASEWYDAEEYHQRYSFKNPDYSCPAHRLFW